MSKNCISITDWTAVAQNTIAKSGELDISDAVMAILHIQAFLDTATAHTGTRFIVQTSGAATGNEDWQNTTTFVELIGTANIEPITNNPLSAAATTITCASTTGYTTLGAWRAIEDATLANSELILETAYVTDTSITILDGTTNEHAQNTNMYSVAMGKDILLLGEAYRVRLVVDNTYSSAGSTLNYKVRATKVTVT
jgi:hypothetical protein